MIFIDELIGLRLWGGEDRERVYLSIVIFRKQIIKH